MKRSKLVAKFCLMLALISSGFFQVNPVMADTLTYGSDIPLVEINSTSPSFQDVPHDHWAFDAIQEMSRLNIIKGYPDGLFRPGRTVTRAEFAKIMASALGVNAVKDSESFYSDVPTDYWAAPYINAVSPYMTYYQLADGRNNFDPAAPIVREDVAVALVLYKGYDEKIADESIIDAIFSDDDSISTNFKKDVALAVENKLMSGYPDRTFRAQGTLTRAEAATLLYRVSKLGNDNKSVNVPSGTTATNPQQSDPIVTNAISPPSWQLINNLPLEKGYTVGDSVYFTLHSVRQIENYPDLDKTLVLVNFTIKNTSEMSETGGFRYIYLDQQSPWWMVDDANNTYKEYQTDKVIGNVHKILGPGKEVTGEVAFNIPNSTKSFTFETGTLSIKIANSK